ncbi:YhbD family protein [Geobacillus thermoleovorans]|uniref:YhbD family protein n=1 Tax=Geobacillus thermoleovorans TaxID=33941 RepID=UPI00345C3D51
MEQELISKKELLELTGISYGQLYRWKRKKLIPEEWFIRKSTFTGQETFFPKEKILARIEKIKELKDELSLDELAGMFAPDPAAVVLTKEEIAKRHIVSDMVLQWLNDELGDRQDVPFAELLSFYIVDRLLRSGEISLEEGKNIWRMFESHYPKLQGKSCELVVLRKMGVTACLLMEGVGGLYAEEGAKLVARLHVPAFIEELKLNISEG